MSVIFLQRKTAYATRGRIDWQKVNRNIEIEVGKENEIIPALELPENPPDISVVIEWNKCVDEILSDKKN